MTKEQIKQSIAKGYIKAVMRYLPEHFGYRYESIETKSRMGVLSYEQETLLKNKLTADILNWCNSDQSTQEKEELKGQVLLGNIDEIIEKFPPELQAKWRSIQKLRYNFEQELLNHLNNE